MTNQQITNFCDLFDKEIGDLVNYEGNYRRWVQNGKLLICPLYKDSRDNFYLPFYYKKIKIVPSKYGAIGI